MTTREPQGKKQTGKKSILKSALAVFLVALISITSGIDYASAANAADGGVAQVVTDHGTVDSDAAENVNSATVVSQWTFGTSEWTLYDDGLLEMGPGVLEDASPGTQWSTYGSDIVTIRLTGPVVADSQSGSLFSGLDNLETIENIELLDTSNVTYTGYMFAFSPKLKSLDLSSWDVSEVAASTSMFMGCFSLEYLNISGWNLSKSAQVSSMFVGASELKTLVLGENSVNVLAPIHDAYLEPILETERYTGNWIGLNTQTIFSGYDFLERYKENPIPDTYVWQAHLVATFESNGGSAVAAQHLLTTDRIALPSDPMRAGYVFKGWYGDQGLTQPWAFSTRIADDVTLHAKWETIGYATVRYVDDAGAYLANAVNLSGVVGSAMNIERKEFEGYEFVEATNDANTPIDYRAVVFGNQSQTITMHYKAVAEDQTKPGVKPDTEEPKPGSAIPDQATPGMNPSNETPTSGSAMPRTGDSANLAAGVAAAFVAGGVLVASLIALRCKKRKGL